MVNNGWVEPASPAPASASSAPETGAEGTPAETDAPAPRLSRGQGRSPRDMALSLAVLIVPIALLLIFYRVVLSGDSPVTVDPAPALQSARQANAFPVVVPQGLGDDWHVSSATFGRRADGATLRIGYVDPDDDPVQLIESSVPAATLLPVELSKSAKLLNVSGCSSPRDLRSESKIP